MMQCDICGKKKATVHLTEIIDEQMTELHLCEDCAKEKSVQMEQQFGLADLLAGLADFGKPAKNSVEKVKLVCSNCGLSYDEFRKLGRLGCSQCYSSFKDNLAGLLKRIHGAPRHVGKRPVHMPAGPLVTEEKETEDLEELKTRLHKAIEMEQFEEAARLRDKIRGLEQRGDRPNHESE